MDGKIIKTVITADGFHRRNFVAWWNEVGHNLRHAEPMAAFEIAFGAGVDTVHDMIVEGDTGGMIKCPWLQKKPGGD